MKTIPDHGGRDLRSHSRRRPALAGRRQPAERRAPDPIDAGVRSGAISQRELYSLRASLRQLTILERQLGLGGLTGRENATLRHRGNTLASRSTSPRRPMAAPASTMADASTPTTAPAGKPATTVSIAPPGTIAT